MFKVFEPSQIIPIKFDNQETISISNISPCASNVHFFTAIKSLGKVNLLRTDVPLQFGLTQAQEVKYLWNFDKTTIPGSSLTAERPVGCFLSNSAVQNYKSSSNDNSSMSHQALFNYLQGYLYRQDNIYSAQSSTSIISSTTSINLTVARVISLRRDLAKDHILPSSFRMEFNNSNSSATGIVTGNATGFTTALDLKNSYGGDIGVPTKSFFGVRWAPNSSLDLATSALTIEAVIRPYNVNSTILWRRLSNSGFDGSNISTQNAFMKLELCESPDKQKSAFRFYIRGSSSDTDFTNTFAQKDVQASGLFIPDDVGINIYDGKFHRLIVSWGISGVDGSNTVESGAGAVFGYIDGYKLYNSEQVDPRLNGSDAANGPVVQTNMFDQRIPLKTTSISYGDMVDGATNSANNLYIGISNYNRAKTDTTGDRVSLALSGDTNLDGGYDGQIQHIRMWNKRFTDGSTGIKDQINKLVTASSTAGILFSNFWDPTLTGGSTSTNIVAWWNFNERNTLSADDISKYSNTGVLVGNSGIDLFDHDDITTTAMPISESSASSILRTYLYTDQPETVLQNGMKQGRIFRSGGDGTITRVGLIYYDLKTIILDNNDANAGLFWLYPASGTTGDFGFTVTGNNNSAFNIRRIAFDSIENRGRLMLNATISGSEYNYSENPTSVSPDTNDSLLDSPATYITTVGLYDDWGNLLAISKLANPIRKDSNTDIIIQNLMDF